MKTIGPDQISNAVAKLCMESNYYLGADVLQALKDFKEREESPVAKELLDQCIINAGIAKEEQVPICQDTGFAVFFVEIGDQVLVEGNLTAAIADGVKRGYQEGYLRKSIVEDPLRRKNTGDNTPPVVWIETTSGYNLKITIAPKGGGSENMSEVKMLKPAEGEKGVKDFVVDRVWRSGSNPCPPVIVGVGIGGTYDKCAQLSKKALLRELGSKHPDPFYAAMEEELLKRINDLGIGPQGLGGRTTALGVFIEAHPCHIASLPVAVNIQCHAARHKSVVL